MHIYEFAAFDQNYSQYPRLGGIRTSHFYIRCRRLTLESSTFVSLMFGKNRTFENLVQKPGKRLTPMYFNVIFYLVTLPP